MKVPWTEATCYYSLSGLINLPFKRGICLVNCNESAPHARTKVLGIVLHNVKSLVKWILTVARLPDSFWSLKWKDNVTLGALIISLSSEYFLLLICVGRHLLASVPVFLQCTFYFHVRPFLLHVRSMVYLMPTSESRRNLWGKKYHKSGAKKLTRNTVTHTGRVVERDIPWGPLSRDVPGHAGPAVMTSSLDLF